MPDSLNRTPSQSVAVLPGFSPEETTLVRFMEICIPSVDPETMENVIAACKMLCENRTRTLTTASLHGCMKQAGFSGTYEQMMSYEPGQTVDATPEERAVWPRR